MSVTVDPGVSIKFSELTPNLFNEVMQLSLYQVRNIKDEKGIDQVDEYAITEGELDFFETQLRYVVPEVFYHLTKWAKGIADSVFIDYDTSTTAECGFSIVDNQAYDANILSVIDPKIRECYTLWILHKWFFHSGLHDLSKEYLAMYNDNIRTLKKKAFDLIKPLMASGS